jgi:hypothetical protein
MSALAPRAKYPTFQFPVPGTRIRGIITRPPEDRQARKFGTDILDFWPDGNPIMETKIVLRVADGTEHAVYAKGRMAKAITMAIVKAGASDLEVGGELEITHSGLGQSKPGAQPAKLFEATYTAPDCDSDEPPF